MQLENLMQQRGVEVPFDDEECNGNFDINKNEMTQQNQELLRKYPAHEQYHISNNGDDDEVPLQLLTAEEKIEELDNLIEHKDNEIEELKMQLQNSIRPETLKERVEHIVQREVEERVKQW